MKKKKISQKDLLIEFYMRNPNRDIPHFEIVPRVMREYKKKTGKVFADPDRGIRKLYQDGFLIQISKGVYHYDPNYIKNRNLEDFDEKTKKAIFERDKYRCIICERGPKEGMEIHADHVKPKDRGGKAILGNGQTLCSQHNFLKKNFGQTTLGKRYFIKLHKSAIKTQDKNLINFCKEVLDLFDKYGIDTNIVD
ncbi:MAG: HNH endonuclease [Candidatus Zambryskibacteria bacterium RIFOXYC1_FULL_39_10]|uniref:HNH endonuclease n=1 Tax=Candidatus Zambryskibacteria bacterium RIFOXYC1_FULL_39_10 TaxID=1802779 RepID=A0A1G2UXZ3_9BACT|nr:MAG: HNH endonuclease [Candidatus Zambryskibacteria bacterium RIFOXYC1_FULL_39_10]OHB14790.1 MAG: HNH endonuclease [Candidatus Zambryskibacteria bacterium RIFOXYD1_FULL_39_35]